MPALSSRWYTHAAHACLTFTLVGLAALGGEDTPVRSAAAIASSGSPARVFILPAPRKEARPATLLPLSQRGIFLTAGSAGSERFRTRTLDHLERAGGNAVIVDAKGPYVHFSGGLLPIAESYDLVRPAYDIRDLVRSVRERGLEIIVRYIAIKDHGGLSARDPRVQLRHPETGAVLTPGWIDPENPTVLALNSEILCALAGSGVDEINLDYIRYDTGRARTISVLPVETRIRKMETFLRMARETIDRCGEGTRLGISTFAILGWDYEPNVPALGQDIVRFAPLVDVISPMAYGVNFSDDYGVGLGPGERLGYLVQRTLEGYRDVLGETEARKLRPWLQGFGVTQRGVGWQIRGTFAGGACGFLVWNADNAYDPVYKALPLMAVPPHCQTTLATAAR